MIFLYYIIQRIPSIIIIIKLVIICKTSILLSFLNVYLCAVVIILCLSACDEAFDKAYYTISNLNSVISLGLGCLCTKKCMNMYAHMH